MSKYDKLWNYVAKSGKDKLTLSYKEIEEIAGLPLDHSFLTYKKELLAFGYKVGKISMKKEMVDFVKEEA